MKNAFKGVTSTFTKFEYRGYLKEQRAEVAGRNATASELDAQIAKLDEMIDDFGIEEVVADYELNQNWIPECETLVNDSQPTLTGSGWKVLKGADAIHAAVAKRVNAQKIATLDKGFTGLSCTTVSPYVLWDVY